MTSYFMIDGIAAMGWHNICYILPIRICLVLSVNNLFNKIFYIVQQCYANSYLGSLEKELIFVCNVQFDFFLPARSDVFFHMLS